MRLFTVHKETVEEPIEIDKEISNKVNATQKTLLLDEETRSEDNEEPLLSQGTSDQVAHNPKAARGPAKQQADRNEKARRNPVRERMRQARLSAKKHGYLK